MWAGFGVLMNSPPLLVATKLFSCRLHRRAPPLTIDWSFAKPVSRFWSALWQHIITRRVVPSSNAIGLQLLPDLGRSSLDECSTTVGPYKLINLPTFDCIF